MSSQYVKVVPGILAEMEQARETDDGQRPPDEIPPDQDAQPEKQTMYVYRTDTGGVLITPTRIEGDEDEQQPPIVDSQDIGQTARRSVPHFVHFLFMLLIFVSLDNIDAFFLLLAPTVTVTITPVTKSLSTTATVTVGGAGADVHGRILQPLTLSQTQTVSATGKGHQDAQRADGALTFYNALFASQFIPAGSIFTGADGIQVQTDAGVTVSANTPPQDGIASSAAHAVNAGGQGNIPSLEINGMASSSLFVKNLAPFQHGQDARDFMVVSKGDIQGVVSQLTLRLLQSEGAAFTAQLVQGESLITPSCTPRTTTNHNAGDEAQSVTVTVAQTCASVAYNAQELETTAARIQTLQRAASLSQYQRVGDVHLVILSQVVNGQQAALRVQLSSTWVYQIDKSRILALIVGKHRLDALHQLTTLAGIQQVSITGISDNQQLPTDPAHVTLQIFYFVS